MKGTVNAKFDDAKGMDTEMVVGIHVLYACESDAAAVLWLRTKTNNKAIDMI